MAGPASGHLQPMTTTRRLVSLIRRSLVRNVPVYEDDPKRERCQLFRGYTCRDSVRQAIADLPPCDRDEMDRLAAAMVRPPVRRGRRADLARRIADYRARWAAVLADHDEELKATMRRFLKLGFIPQTRRKLAALLTPHDREQAEETAVRA